MPDYTELSPLEREDAAIRAQNIRCAVAVVGALLPLIALLIIVILGVYHMGPMGAP